MVNKKLINYENTMDSSATTYEFLYPITPLLWLEDGEMDKRL